MNRKTYLRHVFKIQHGETLKDSEAENKGSGDHRIHKWLNNDWKFTKPDVKMNLETQEAQWVPNRIKINPHKTHLAKTEKHQIRSEEGPTKEQCFYAK